MHDGPASEKAGPFDWESAPPGREPPGAAIAGRGRSVRPEGFEPPTGGLEIRCSIH